MTKAVQINWTTREEIQGASRLKKVRNAALQSPDVKDSIILRTMERLKEMRKRNPKFKAIVQAENIDEGKELKNYWINFINSRTDYQFTVEFVEGSMPENIKKKIYQELEKDKLDIIIHVQLLGEGFDHPYLVVAAIFKSYGSIGPFAQFVGRILRTM